MLDDAELIPRTPTLSVIVPCYNYARFLPECVSSALDQEGVDVRVLVIDDASTDASGEVAAELGRTDQRVEVVRHRVNRGHIATYNEGLEWASGRYLLLLSADDLIVPGALRRACSYLEHRDDMSFIYGPTVWFVDGGPRPTPRTNDADSHVTIWPGNRWIQARCHEARNRVDTPSVVVRTAAQRSVGGYRPELPHAGDLEMWMRLACIGSVGELHGVEQAIYRRHGASMGATRFAGYLDDLDQRRLAFDSLFASDLAATSAVSPLDALWKRRIARDAIWGLSRSMDRGENPPAPAGDVVGFARKVFPSVDLTGAYLGLRLREALGPDLTRRSRPLRDAVLMRQVRARRGSGR